MVVCVNGMFAQTNNEINDSDIVSGESVKHEATTTNKSQSFTKEDMVKLWKEFQNYAAEAQNEERVTLSSVPISGKTKFTRRHYITQRLEISVIGGSDTDNEESGELHAVYKNEDDVDETLREGTNFNYGLNIGYSLVLVPGQINGEMLELNKLGFGYSLGFVASFDRQDYYGTTCDILSKIGIEAGNGHKMGIGLDFLIGTGKSAGEYSFFLKDENPDGNNEIEQKDLPYTSWCLKYGGQLWVRSNLLKASIKNTDIRLFARYVYSKNPEDENKLMDNGIICNWMTESWNFGLTFCYTF